MESCDLSIAKQFNGLKSLSEKERNLVEENCVPQVIHKGDIIFLENEYLQKLYCIYEGACKFSIFDVKGNEHITQILGTGELMGRRALISKKGAMVTATALTDGVVFCLDKEDILQGLSQNNEFCFDVLKGFVKDSAEARMKIELFQNQENLKKRLSGLLLYLTEKFGVQKDKSIKLPLKREDMANVLGTSSEYIVTLLAQFKKDNLIRLQKGKISIVSKKKLQRILS